MNQLKHYSDIQVIEGILAGGRRENEAIEALFERFKGVLMRFIQNKTSKEYAQQPEDFVWEGIEAVVMNIKEGKYHPQEGTNLEAYVKTVCKNLWLKYYASETARENRQTVYIDFEVDHEPDVSHLLAEKQAWDRYLKIFETLGKNCKEILHLSFAEDMPMKELAAKLVAEGKYENEQVVRNAKSKCLGKLTELLKTPN